MSLVDNRDQTVISVRVIFDVKIWRGPLQDAFDGDGGGGAVAAAILQAFPYEK